MGTPVHQSVTVKDQLGQAIPGMDVKFVRSGPNARAATTTTSDGTGAAGTANYDWVGTDAGTAKVSAFVYDDWERLRHRCAGEEVHRQPDHLR